jgi:hypothetical protein
VTAKVPLTPDKAEELEQLREALADAVDRSSLRAVSRQIPMTPTGLSGIIGGAEPYPRTWEKLRVWYAAHSARTHPSRDLPPAAIVGVLRTLLRRVPNARQGWAMGQVFDAFEAVHRATGATRPEWIDEVRRLVSRTGWSPGDAE